MPWINYDPSGGDNPRVTRLFEIHDQAYIDTLSPEDGDASWIDWSRGLYPDVPVYCDPTRMHLFKNAIEYPLKEVMDYLPFPSLESTLSYMVGCALYECRDEEMKLGLYGVHMMGRGEFNWQRQSVQYLVGYAQGRHGRDAVIIPPGSPLFMSGYIAGRYGRLGGMRVVDFTPGPQGREQTLMEKPMDQVRA